MLNILRIRQGLKVFLPAADYLFRIEDAMESYTVSSPYQLTF